MTERLSHNVPLMQENDRKMAEIMFTGRPGGCLEGVKVIFLSRRKAQMQSLLYITVLRSMGVLSLITYGQLYGFIN